MIECDVNGEITLGEIVDEVNVKTSIGKNRIINGDFAVWQDTDLVVERNVSEAYGADLFYGYIDTNFTAGKFTFSKSAMGQDTSLKATVNTAFAGSSADRYSTIFEFGGEAVDIYDCLGGDITISFKFRSNVTGTFPCTLILVDASNNRSSYITTFDYSSAGTIQDVEVSIDVPDNAELTYDVTNTPGNQGFILAIGQVVGSGYHNTADEWDLSNDWRLATSSCTNWATSAGNSIEIARLQLEKGSSKTEFEKIDYGEQLARVQRYYKKYSALSSGGTGYAVADTVNLLGFKLYYNDMRDKPSVTNNLAYTNCTYSSIFIQNNQLEITVTKNSADGSFRAYSGSILLNARF